MFFHFHVQKKSLRCFLFSLSDGFPAQKHLADFVQRVRAGQGRASQGRAGQARACQDRTGQDRAGRVGKGRVGQGRAGQGRQGYGRSGRTRPGQGRPGRQAREVRACQGKAGQARGWHGRVGQGKAGQGRDRARQGRLEYSEPLTGALIDGIPCGVPGGGFWCHLLSSFWNSLTRFCASVLNSEFRMGVPAQGLP